MHQIVSSSPARRTFSALAALLLLALSTNLGVASAQREAAGNLLVYHQITDLDDPAVGVGTPVLSADGSRAVFSHAPGTGGAETPNRIFVINADGSGLAEVDSYQPRCGCGAFVDISADGKTIVSSDSMQVRIADGGGARELLAISSNEITAIRLSADGETVFLLVRRDAGTADGDTLERGVWAIDADGDNLRQVVGASDVAALFDIPPDQYGCCLHGGGGPLDVSADGGHVVFGAYGTGGEYVFGVEGDGGGLHQLAGPFAYLWNAAISGDGATVAYDAVEDPSGTNEVGVVDFAGGEPRILATRTGSSSFGILHLSEDGSQLLLTPSSLLVDTASGDLRQLAAQTPGGSSHSDLLTEGMVRASMNADATRFLYVMRSIRCADCVNLPEQLATLDLDPADLGNAPMIDEATIEPDEIGVNRGSMATASAAVNAEGEIVAVGLVALREGVHDINVGNAARLVDDGSNGDARANDGVYTFESVSHAPFEAREDDPGPRTVRIQAEIESPNGLRHATAVDVGTLTVVAGT